MKKAFTFILCLLGPLLAGGIGSFFTYQSIPTWYATIQKPFFTPPNSLFGPVWTLLYILMGVSLFIVLGKKQTLERKVGIIFFMVQLSLNTLWSILFFGLQSPFLALIGIIFLWISILMTMIYFYKVSKIAGMLFLPYIVWVSFATLLNFYIMILN